MNNSTYEQRVQTIAEKMAKNQYERAEKEVMRLGVSFSDLTDLQKKIYTDTKMADARIAVAEMAEAVIIYAFGSLEDYNQLVEQGQEFDYMDRVLKEQGLIPDTEQEAAANE